MGSITSDLNNYGPKIFGEKDKSDCVYTEHTPYFVIVNYTKELSTVVNGTTAIQIARMSRWHRNFVCLFVLGTGFSV